MINPNLYAAVDSELGTNINDGNLDKSTDIELRVGNNGTMAEGSVENSSQLAQNDPMVQESSGTELPLIEGDEPYIGQEFESEVAAQEFYSAYGQKMGFNIRVSNLCRSRRDGTLTSRTLVCNKEGYRVSDKRNRTNVRQRVPTRVGCKAMVSVKKLNSGRWVINKFVKEHNHALTPEKDRDGLIYNQPPVSSFPLYCVINLSVNFLELLILC